MSNSTKPLQPLPDLLKNLATLTGLPLKQLEDQTKDLNFPFFEFQGQILVSADAIDPIIDQWAGTIKDQLQATAQSAEDAKNEAAGGKAKTSRGGRKPGVRAAKPPTSSSKRATPAKKTASKPATAKAPAAKTATPTATKGGGRGKGRSTKATAKSKSPGIPNPTPAASVKASLGSNQLPLPPGFADMVSTRYDSTLSKVLPSDSGDRQRYLAEITQETKVGQNFLNQLAVTLERKYKGRVSQQRAYAKLLAAATALAA